MIIDFHAHMFPTDVINDPEKYCKLDPYFGLLAGSKYTLQRYATGEEAIALADKAGVEKIVMQGWYWQDHGLCQYHNDYMYDLIKKYPERFIAFASINPRAGQRAIREIERCHEMGFAGIGELGPGGQGWDLHDKEFLNLMEAAVEYTMLVSIHAGEPVGRAYPGKDITSLQGFYELVKKLPDLKLILAHWGGGLPFYELMPDVSKAFTNVYYDTAASPLLYKMDIFKAVIDIVGAEKILFGSDFPLLVYPKKQQEADFSMFIEDIKEQSGLQEDELNLIFRENALKLLTSVSRSKK